jgi:hypothetical protein
MRAAARTAANGSAAMTKLSADAMPTVRQGTTLAILSTAPFPLTARQIPVRSDVLWRMSEAGWVARTAHDEWYIKSVGSQALERWERR